MNKKPQITLGGVILGIGAIGYAAYRFAKEKARLEREKQAIDITPADNENRTDE